MPEFATNNKTIPCLFSRYKSVFRLDEYLSFCHINHLHTSQLLSLFYQNSYVCFDNAPIPFNPLLPSPVTTSKQTSAFLSFFYQSNYYQELYSTLGQNFCSHLFQSNFFTATSLFDPLASSNQFISISTRTENFIPKFPQVEYQSKTKLLLVKANFLYKQYPVFPSVIFNLEINSLFKRIFSELNGDVSCCHQLLILIGQVQYRVNHSMSYLTAVKKRLDRKYSIKNFENLELFKILVPRKVVAKEVISLVSKFLPQKFLGTNTNWNKFNQSILTSIFRNLGEEISIENLIAGIKIKDIPWFLMKGQKVSRSRHHNNQSIFKILIAFIFEHLIHYLTSFLFYVTDSPNFGGKFLFFTHKSWTKFCQLSTPPNLLPVQKSFIFDCSRDYWSRIKFYPKNNYHIRPIVVTKYKNSSKFHHKYSSSNCSKFSKYYSNNPVRSSLKFEIVLQRVLTSLCGSSAEKLENSFSIGSINNFLKQIRNVKTMTSSPEREFFLCKFDIKSAFDSLNHELLLKFVTEILHFKNFQLDEFSIAKFTANNSFFISKSSFCTKNFTDFSCFPKNSLIFPLKNSEVFESQTLIYQCKSFLDSLYVEFNFENCFKYKFGVPQGFFISPLLCSFYFYKFEQFYLSNFCICGGCKLIRYVDDYLMIGSDYICAKNLVNRLSMGFSRFNLIINWAKFRTNFVLDSGLFSNDLISFCGFHFDNSLNLIFPIPFEVNNLPLKTLRGNMNPLKFSSQSSGKSVWRKLKKLVVRSFIPDYFPENNRALTFFNFNNLYRFVLVKTLLTCSAAKISHKFQTRILVYLKMLMINKASLFGKVSVTDLLKQISN
ncbi:hypothetical protein RCL1_005265 [Eukaryota sp. TZLM3-RCL]